MNFGSIVIALISLSLNSSIQAQIIPLAASRINISSSIIIKMGSSPK
jgi:hypothetical protein